MCVMVDNQVWLTKNMMLCFTMLSSCKPPLTLHMQSYKLFYSIPHFYTNPSFSVLGRRAGKLKTIVASLKELAQRREPSKRMGGTARRRYRYCVCCCCCATAGTETVAACCCCCVCLPSIGRLLPPHHPGFACT